MERRMALSPALLGALTVVLVFGLAGPAAANGAICGDPLAVTLWAGQHIDVGTVTVSNDADYLYVTFDITSPWVLVETHVHVASSASGIPQTKSGNPKVGHFEEGETHDPGTTGYTFPFDLAARGYEPGDAVYVAAHAVVMQVIGGGCGSPQWASTVVGYVQGTLVGGGPVTDPLRQDPTAALGAPDASTTPPATGFYSLGFVSNGDGYLTLAFDNPVYNAPGPDIVVREVTWGRPGYPDEAADVYVIAGGSQFYAGTVTNHDNPDGSGYVEIPDGMSCIDAVKLVDATDPGLYGGRPTADGYDVDAVGACYLCGQTETAWGDGFDFPGRSWAMYLCYEVQSCD